MAGFNERAADHLHGCASGDLAKDSKLRVVRARKILNHEANISKAVSVTLLL